MPNYDADENQRTGYDKTSVNPNADKKKFKKLRNKLLGK